MDSAGVILEMVGSFWAIGFYPQIIIDSLIGDIFKC